MPEPMNAAGRRYVSRFAVAMSLYAGLVLTTPVVFRHTDSLGLRVAAALLPAIALLGVIWAVMRYLVEEQDEYLRARLAQALLVGLGLTLSICTVWGFLESYGLVARLPLVDVFPLFCGVWGLSHLGRRLLEMRS